MNKEEEVPRDPVAVAFATTGTMAVDTPAITVASTAGLETAAEDDCTVRQFKLSN